MFLRQQYITLYLSSVVVVLPKSRLTDIQSNISLWFSAYVTYTIFYLLYCRIMHCTYRYVGTSLHDVHSLTKQLHNIYLNMFVCLGGKGCCLACLKKNKRKII